MISESTRTAGVTAFLTADGIDLIVRTATKSVRESISYSELSDCEVAGRKAKLELGDDVIAFATDKCALLLRPYQSRNGSTYYWSALEPIESKPSISLEEAKKLVKPKRRAARKAS